ncbi:MAG TPA: enoyl-CoA hydratase-related protein [Gemmatimonadales bacterium]|nr:enoyl-CoA hydratase-related protein [Gemmatimonadales bacterium]
MTFSTLLFSIQDGVASVTINRPDKLNALNDTVFRELTDVVARLESDSSIRGVILTGAGAKAFAAGADISELASQTPHDAKARALTGQGVMGRIERLGKPVVAAVNGFCLGGGCELAMACHIRLASDNARFGQPEVNLGIGPGYGGTVRLPRLVGRGRALELLLTAQVIDAHEAYRIGLVNRVFPQDQLLVEAEKMIRLILSKGPLAVRLVIESVIAGADMAEEDHLLLEANHFGLLSASADMKEGMAAFLAKRPPRFRGE